MFVEFDGVVTEGDAGWVGLRSRFSDFSEIVLPDWSWTLYRPFAASYEIACTVLPFSSGRDARPVSHKRVSGEQNREKLLTAHGAPFAL